MFFKKCGIYNDRLKNKTIINDVNEDFMDLESLFEYFFKEFNIKNSMLLMLLDIFIKYPFLIKF